MNKIWVKVKRVDLIDLLFLLSNTAKVIDVEAEFIDRSAVVGFKLYEDEKVSDEDYFKEDKELKEENAEE